MGKPNFDPDEPPRYRVTAPSPICVHSGVLLHPGEEFDHAGWPPPGTAPVNEAARRIAAHHGKFAGSGVLPGSPYDSDYGRIYLPAAYSFDARNPDLVAVPEADELPGMPAYRVLAVSPRGGFGGPQWRGREVRQGDVIRYLCWPFSGLSIEPANGPAEQVVAYLAANATHMRMPPAPWDFWTQTVFLPELPKVVRSLRDGVDQYEQHHETARLVNGIVDRHRAAAAAR